MQQVKIFKSIESELLTLEQEINEWVSQSGVKIVSITGNIAAQSASTGSLGDTFSGSDVLLFVLYEKVTSGQSFSSASSPAASATESGTGKGVLESG